MYMYMYVCNIYLHLYITYIGQNYQGFPYWGEEGSLPH